MTAAAETLNVAQPALGFQIRQLEAELGVELLTRHSRGAAPTTAGELLYSHAQQILDGVAKAAKEVGALKAGKRMHLRLGISRTMSRILGADLLSDRQRTMPDVTVNVLEERMPVLLQALEEGRIDVAFLNNVGEWAGLERKAVVEEDLLFVTASPQAGQQDSIEFADVLQHELVIGGERGILRHTVENEARRLSLEVRMSRETRTMAASKEIIAKGAMAIMPYSFVAEEVHAGTLAARRIVRPAITRTLYLVRRSNRSDDLDDERIARHLTMIVEAYADHLKPWARKL